MTIITKTLWPGHVITEIWVERWIAPYRWINLLCARRTYRHELAIRPTPKARAAWLARHPEIKAILDQIG